MVELIGFEPLLQLHTLARYPYIIFVLISATLLVTLYGRPFQRLYMWHVIKGFILTIQLYYIIQYFLLNF